MSKSLSKYTHPAKRHDACFCPLRLNAGGGKFFNEIIMHLLTYLHLSTSMYLLFGVLSTIFYLYLRVQTHK